MSHCLHTLTHFPTHTHPVIHTPFCPLTHLVTPTPTHLNPPVTAPLHTLSSMSPLPSTISALAFMKDSWPSCMCWKISSASSLSGYCTEIRSLKKLKTDCLNLSSTLSRTRFVWGSHSSYSHLYEMIRFFCK